MIEVREEQLLKLLEHDSVVNEAQVRAVYFFTPLCGTCKVAERMLEVTEAALPELVLYKANVNEMPASAAAWQLTSVPCLAIFQGGVLQNRRYAMNGAAELYSFLKTALHT